LVAASTLSSEVADGAKSTGNIEAAKAVGQALAKKALEKNVQQVVFDRNGFLYHGRVKALAEGAREAGLSF
jgi:large subunit ribosomal protein L18